LYFSFFLRSINGFLKKLLAYVLFGKKIAVFINDARNGCCGPQINILAQRMKYLLVFLVFGICGVQDRDVFIHCDYKVRSLVHDFKILSMPFIYSLNSLFYLFRSFL